MNALQKPGRIAGLWFIGTFVFSIPALFFYDKVLNNANYILGQGFDTRVSVGALLEILTAICNIASAVVLYPVLKRVNQPVALGYVASRTVESTFIVVGLISLMSVVTLRDDLTGGAGGGSASLVGKALVTLHDWAFLLGPQFCSGLGTGILLGYLMYRSGLVPRGMALLGLIGGPLAFLGGVFVLFGVIDNRSGALFAFTAIEIVWEASLAIYLTVKGYKPSPLLAETSLAATVPT